MPATINNNPTNYGMIVDDLLNPQSQFNIAKQRFETKFQSFLCKYRPYSDINNVPFNQYILNGKINTS